MDAFSDGYSHSLLQKLLLMMLELPHDVIPLRVRSKTRAYAKEWKVGWQAWISTKILIERKGGREKKPKLLHFAAIEGQQMDHSKARR